MATKVRAPDERVATCNALLANGRVQGHDFQDGKRMCRAGVATIVYACRQCPAQVLLRLGPGGFARAQGIDRPCPRYWGRSPAHDAAAYQQAETLQPSLLAPQPESTSIVLRRRQHAYVALDVQVLNGGYTARRFCPQCQRVSTYRASVSEPDATPCQVVLDTALPEVRALLARLL